MKVFCAGATLVVALSGCSSNGGGSTNGVVGAAGAGFTSQPGGGVANNGAGGTPTGAGGTAPQGTGDTPSAGGSITNPGSGGSITNPGAGGSITNPGSGGSITNPASGGSTTNPGGGGTTTDPGAGGTSPMGGAGGTAGGSGSAGTVTLVHCTQVGETSAHPVTDPCMDITDAAGGTLKLGPYGASMDVNVGKGFENPNPNDDATCPAFVGIFAGETLSNQLLDTGPQPCTESTPNSGNCLNYQLFTVYRPANWPSGPIPVITWGNGTCAQPEGYGALLRYFASYGFFVVAANSRETGSGAPIQKALDFVTAANKDMSSPYFGHLDMTKVGVAGHSQGGMGAANAANADSRIQYAILVSPYPSGSTTKPFLVQAADQDVNSWSAASLNAQVQAANKAAYLYYHNPAGAAGDGFKGHLVLMLSPERVAPAFTAWWQLLFQNDMTAKNMFVGSNCGLCGHSSDYDFGEKGL
ncbi:MAG TPA: hypothetical protein VHC69_25230 [Polyangiaceae bacterium]|nr:hypothetical protein [Polyangiaceae bacterium]